MQVLISKGVTKQVCGDCHKVNVRFTGGRHTCEGCLAKRRWLRFVEKIRLILEEKRRCS